jgi:hypothetical protein
MGRARGLTAATSLKLTRMRGRGGGGAFRAEFRAMPDPGLKPWAVLYSRFAKKTRSDTCPRFRLHITRKTFENEEDKDDYEVSILAASSKQ